MGDNVEQIKSGDRIADRYVLSERIGAGGFGETWKAHDELLDVDVAVKVFADSGPEQRDRYLHEARSLAQYSKHPGIAAVRDFLAVGDRMCLVMEYVVGVDLVNVISANGQLDLQTVLVVLGPVADALTSLHEAGLLHRDVSPDNIRVRSDGKGVLLDFGSVLAVEDTMRRTIVVKPGYAPPEQYGDASAQGPWTDVYALAATAYHALTGQVPSDSLKRTFTDDLRRPSALGVNIPKPAEDALMRALELDYRKRTKSVDKLMAGLTQISKTDQRVVVTPAKESRPHEMPQAMKTAANRKHEDDPNTRKAVSLSKRTPPKAKSNHGSSHARKLKPMIVGLAIVVALGLIIALIHGPGNMLGDYKSPYNDGLGNGFAVVSDEEFTDTMVDQIMRDKKCDGYIFDKCKISDGQLERLASKENLSLVKLASCSGFTTLAPFAEASDLYWIGLEETKNLDLDALFPKDMANVTKLHIRESTVVNQGEGLSHFPNMKELDLSATTGIERVDFLEGMPNINFLKLNGIAISHAEEGKLTHALSNMPRLSFVGLNGTGITGVDWAANCSNLSYIYLNDNQIADASPLSSATTLKEVSLANNKLTNVDFCEPLIKLETLDVSRNQISDISKLAGCAYLKELYLQGNQITELSALKNGFSELTTLNVAANQLTSFQGLSDCVALKYVVANNNQLTNLTGLEGKPDLTLLLLDGNQISDISALSDCAAHLMCLDLGHNQVSDISALSGFGTESPSNDLDISFDIHGLLLDHNQINSIEKLPQIKYDVLVLYGNSLKDLTVLDETTWVELYLPYVEGAGYGFAADAKGLLVDTKLVGVPYNRQVQVLRDMGLDANSTSDLPEFLTEEEADTELRQVRDEVNSRVSGFESGTDAETETASDEAGSTNIVSEEA